MSEASVIGAGDSLSPAQILSGRYCVCRKIGQGGMGEVYLAYDEHMKRYVAIKLLRPGTALLDAKHAKLFEEALTTAALDHRDIVKVYDVPQIAKCQGIPQRLWGAYYMVMEFVKGDTLFLQLRDRQPARTVEEALFLWRELVGIVRFAHDRGIIHRDLKPGNIIVTSQGIKVLDFGIAQASERVTEAGDAPMLCSPSGTPWYMRPAAMHALESNQRIAPDKRDDVYSLAVILYQMLAGELCHPLELEGRRSNEYLELPERGRFPDAYLRKSCDDLIVRALGLDPGNEVRDGAMLYEACQQLLAGWQNYKREQSDRLAKSVAEQQLCIQQAQHAEQQQAIKRQARRWLFTMAALAALVFWSGVFSIWYFERRRENAALVTFCERTAISANRKNGLDDKGLTDLLTGLRVQIAKKREVPESCIQVFNRSVLEPYGLRRMDKQSLAALSSVPARWMNDHLKTIHVLAIAPDAGIVAAGGESGHFAVRKFLDGWKLLPALPAQLLPPQDFPIGSVALSSDGRWLGLAYDGGRIASLLRVESGERIRSPELPYRMHLSALSIEAGGTRVVLGAREGAVFSWRPGVDDQPLQTLLKQDSVKAPIRQLALLQSNILLATTENRVSLWSVSGQLQLADLTMQVKWLVPHKSAPPELVVQAPRGLQLWTADPARLQQMSHDKACTLSEVMNNAPEAEGIARNAKSSPLLPVPDYLWACYRVICQRLQATSSDNSQVDAVCGHLDQPDHLSFMEFWGSP